MFYLMDEAFHGVKLAEGFVMVPLPPDPPLFARFFDAPQPTGRQIEMRVPVLVGAADRGHALAVAEWAEDQVFDGHLRCIEVNGVSQIDLRHRLEAESADNHRVIQTGLRMSQSALMLGPRLTSVLGGSVVRSSNNDDTPQSLGFKLC